MQMTLSDSLLQALQGVSLLFFCILNQANNISHGSVSDNAYWAAFRDQGIFLILLGKQYNLQYLL